MLNDADYEKYGTAGQQKGLLEDDALIEEPAKLCSDFLKYYVLFVPRWLHLQGWIWNTYGPISITVEKEGVLDGTIRLLLSLEIGAQLHMWLPFIQRSFAGCVWLENKLTGSDAADFFIMCY